MLKTIDQKEERQGVMKDTEIPEVPRSSEDEEHRHIDARFANK